MVFPIIGVIGTGRSARGKRQPWDERGTLWGSETVSKPPGSETPLLAKLSPQAAKVVRTAGAISVAKRVMEASTSGR